jgi:phospholipid-binding lipoprotein MlaA
MRLILFIFILSYSLSLNANDDFYSDFENEFEEELIEQEAQDEIFDPLFYYNRFMTDVNDGLMIYVIEPVNTGYKFVIPKPARKSVNNFFNNLYYPVSVTNNLLQLKFEHSWNETLRFLSNSTLGILGLFDVADEWFDIKPHTEDFGQTLGHYGVGSGFPIVLPFFGQSNLRDFVGDIGNAYLDPIYHSSLQIEDDMVSYSSYIAVKAYRDLNEYSLEDISYEDLTKDALELYPFIRDAYEQNRNQLIEE